MQIRNLELREVNSIHTVEEMGIKQSLKGGLWVSREVMHIQFGQTVMQLFSWKERLVLEVSSVMDKPFLLG